LHWTVDRMSDAEQDKRSDQRSRWNMIASLLGAAVPEEPEQPSASEEQADESAQPAAPAVPAVGSAPPSQPKPKRPRPERRPSNWNDLCGELGIDAPAVPAASEDTSLPVPTAPPAIDQPVAAEEIATAPAEDLELDRDPSLTFFDPDAVLEEDTVDVDLGAAERVQPEVDDAEEPEEDTRITERDMPEESTGRGKRRRRRRRRTEPTEREEVAADDAPSLAGDEVNEEPDIEAEPAGDEVVDRDEGDESARPERGRRSRRRRRRPTRREEAPADEDVVSGVAGHVADADADADELDTEVDEVDEDDEDDDEDDEGSIREGHAGRSGRGDESRRGEGGGRTKHKKIPTWEEAISVIVATNLEARRRDGNGKNRPRGPRRRGRGSNDRS